MKNTSDAGVETAIVLEVGAALLAALPAQITVIDVTSEKGAITLRGRVDSAEVRRMAGEIASSHPGVISAVNDLVVTAPQNRAAPEERKV